MKILNAVVVISLCGVLLTKPAAAEDTTVVKAAKLGAPNKVAATSEESNAGWYVLGGATGFVGGGLLGFTIGTIVRANSCEPESDFCGLAALGTGFGTGILGGVFGLGTGLVITTLVLDEPKPTKVRTRTSAQNSPRITSVSLSPTAQAGGRANGLMLGLGGAF